MHALRRASRWGLLAAALVSSLVAPLPGTGFEVILGDAVSTAASAAADRTVSQVGPATRNVVQATLRGRRPDPLPPPRPGEVTISQVSVQEVQEECECDRCVGCATTYFLGSFIQRAAIRLSPQSQAPTVAHELGHAIGLGHIISATGVRPPFTMGLTPDGQFSPTGRLDVLDPATVAMLQTIYGAGLTAGASRRQFEAMGLVLPESQISTIRPRPARPLEGSLTQEGVETVVRRPVCQER